ncbi:Cytochrome P450 [Popillia japonica]|uniref:Cytochrome P450 n=1 Tax=Popillia japonica TaxID=7064 RepID=A0AAW1J1D8_POPJA
MKDFNMLTLIGDLIVLLIIPTILVRMFFKKKFSYWKERGVPQLEASIPFGNGPNPFKIRQPFFQIVKNYYDVFRSQGHKHGGIYITTKPVYMTIDPDYIKNVMSRDFQYFYDRGTYYNEKGDPLSAHLFNLEGQKWKSLRQKLTPTFTSGKMKMMFPTLLNCGNQMLEEIERLSSKNEAIDIKEILGCYSTDVIGSCAFGLDCNSFKVPDAEFRLNGRNLFKPTLKRRLRIFLVANFPNICKRLGVVFIPKEVSNFFLNVVKEVIEYREKNHVHRNDFMQILMDMRNKDDEEMSIKQVAAQAFVFFIAGFETSATTINFCLFELAQNAEIQQKVRDEIEDVLQDEEVTYDSVDRMKYLDQVIDETLRKYPAVPHLSRKCTTDYRIPGTNTILEKNRRVYISILGLHRDPEYYPDPEKFDPERFSTENKAKRHPFTFIPFGEGPRNCIGSRFGMMQTKVGLILLLRNFRVSLNGRTELPLVLEPSALLMTTRNKIWLDVEKVHHSVLED